MSKVLHVCMLAAEAYPFAKVGGLADAVSGLSQALVRLGIDVKVFIPAHRQVTRSVELKELARIGRVSSGSGAYPARVLTPAEPNSAMNYFIHNDDFFDREGVYGPPGDADGYADNFERYNFFILAALEALREMGSCPDILHCHDSQTALTPAYLKLGRMGEPFYAGISTVYTIHNLAYQGIFDASKFRLTGLPQELFYPMGPFEYFGQLNLMKAGICYGDLVNTVSPQYAREIQTPEFGCGLEAVLERRRGDLFGILNGIDEQEWNPETDPLIFANYSPQDLEGKQINKKKLQEAAGLVVRDVPLLGMISRLVDQKGLDLLLEIQTELMTLDCQWIVLGSGLKKYEQALSRLAQEHPDKLKVELGYDNRLAHRIEAGCDIFVMPSRFEPCGLNQMYSMRYGTIPVVRYTGGLVDTVRDFDENRNSGTGFKFYNYDSRECLAAIRRAVEVWRDKQTWKGLMVRAMSHDFSWNRSAREYVELYRRAIDDR